RAPARRLRLTPAALPRREDQLVRRVDHDRVPVLDADRALEPDPRAAHDARDVRAAVEQRGERAGAVGDLAGQHRVLLHRPDLDDADPALAAVLARLADRADRGDAGCRGRRVALRPALAIGLARRSLLEQAAGLGRRLRQRPGIRALGG